MQIWHVCVNYVKSLLRLLSLPRASVARRSLFEDLSSVNEFHMPILFHLVLGIVCIHNTWWFPTRDQNIRNLFFLFTFRHSDWESLQQTCFTVVAKRQKRIQSIKWRFGRPETCNLAENKNLYWFVEIWWKQTRQTESLGAVMKLSFETFQNLIKFLGGFN